MTAKIKTVLGRVLILAGAAAFAVSIYISMGQIPPAAPAEALGRLISAGAWLFAGTISCGAGVALIIEALRK